MIILSAMPDMTGMHIINEGRLLCMVFCDEANVYLLSELVYNNICFYCMQDNSLFCLFLLFTFIFHVYFNT